MPGKRGYYPGKGFAKTTTAKKTFSGASKMLAKKKKGGKK